MLLHGLRRVRWRRLLRLRLLRCRLRLLESRLSLALLLLLLLLALLRGLFACPLRFAGLGNLEVDLDRVVRSGFAGLLGLGLQAVGQIAEHVVHRKMHG